MLEGMWSRKISQSAMPRNRSSLRSRVVATMGACIGGDPSCRIGIADICSWHPVIYEHGRSAQHLRLSGIQSAEKHAKVAAARLQMELHPWKSRKAPTAR